MGSFAEHFIRFVIAHNTTVIEVVVLAVMVASLYLAFRSLSPAENAPIAAGPMPALDELEKTLQKILEKTATSAAAQPAPSEETLREIENLREKLNDRQKEIESLKVSSQSAGISSDERAKLEEKIKELSAKLSEYEIISEDIADLSLYKEENVKLRKEIETLKSAPPAAAASAAAPAPPKEKKPEPEIVTPKREPVTAAPPPPQPAVPAPPPVESAPPSPAAPPPAAAAAATSSEEGGIMDDDLMAEFAKAVEQQKAAEKVEAKPAPTPKAEASAAPELEAKSDINFDKILSEANNLPEGSETSTTSLEASELNTAKLEGEADQLTKTEG